MQQTPDLGQGWTPHVRQRLQEALLLGKQRVDKGKRAVAIFDFDHTCIYGDIGASFASFLSENLLFRYDLDAFWELIPHDTNPSQQRQIVQQLLQDPDNFKNSPLYHNFLQLSLALYDQYAQKHGKPAALQWSTQLHLGISELDMATFSIQAIRRALKRPVTRKDDTDFNSSLQKPSGIRPYVEICKVMRALESVGFELWIVSATNFWTVSTFAGHFGITEDRVLGNRVKVEAGSLTSDFIPPLLFGKGKKEIIKKYIQERPLIVFGDSMTDYDMLKYAKPLAVLIDYNNPDILLAAKKYKWAIQPAKDLHLYDSLSQIPRPERLFDPYDAPPLTDEIPDYQNPSATHPPHTHTPS